MIVLPILIYFVDLVFILKKTNNLSTIKNDCNLTMQISGVFGSSLLVYFILLGGVGLMNARRLSVNVIFVKLFFLYFIMFIVLKLINKNLFRNFKFQKYKIVVLCFLVAVLFQICPLNQIKINFNLYCKKESTDTYSLTLIKEFLREVDNLPSNAKLYTGGWWQSPSVTLFLDRKMVNLDYFDSETDNTDPYNSYFIVGAEISGYKIQDLEKKLNANLTKINKIKVDYKRHHCYFDRENVENFAIYTIKFR